MKFFRCKHCKAVFVMLVSSTDRLACPSCRSDEHLDAEAFDPVASAGGRVLSRLIATAIQRLGRARRG